MADQGKRLDDSTKAYIRRLCERGMNKTAIAKAAMVSRPTAYKYATDKKSSE